MTIDELFNSKMKLKQGDVIRFHDWGVGGNLVGVIADLPPFKDDPDNRRLNIWRPKAEYYLMSPHIDCIKIIRSFKDLSDPDFKYVKKYVKNELIEILHVASRKGIPYTFNDILPLETPSEQREFKGGVE